MQSHIIQATLDEWKENPDKGKLNIILRSSLFENQAKLEIGPFSWYADFPPPLGGQNLSPSPILHLVGSLATCGLLLLKNVIAPQEGLEIDEISTEVECNVDAGGLVGLENSIPDIKDMSLKINIKSSATAEKLHMLLEIWKKRCPVYLSMIKPLKVQTIINKVEI